MSTAKIPGVPAGSSLPAHLRQQYGNPGLRSRLYLHGSHDLVHGGYIPPYLPRSGHNGQKIGASRTCLNQRNTSDLRVHLHC